MDGPRTLGQIIRSRRQSLGLTQEELAARIGGGVRQAEVSRLESDRISLPRRQRLERIAAALGMPVGELLAGAGWTGAEQAFRSERETTAHANSHAPVVFRPTTMGTDVQTAPRSPELHAKLQAAIEQSREIRERTAQILEVSSEVAAVWFNGGTVRRPRSDAS